MFLSPKIGDEITIEAGTTVAISELKVLVFGFGKVLHTSSVGVFFQTSSSISFETTDEMFPFVDVLVYYVSDSGAIISDDLRVTFAMEGQNSVSFFSTRSVIPIECSGTKKIWESLN